MYKQFRISALPVERFAALFNLTDEELARQSACRRIADTKPGYPCRVSLAEAEIGERVLLLPYTHHAVDSPYRASGPIYVRENARQAVPQVGEVPDVVRHRQLAVRAYDADHFMVESEVIEGQELEAQIERFFGERRVAYLHIHNARA